MVIAEDVEYVMALCAIVIVCGERPALIRSVYKNFLCPVVHIFGANTRFGRPMPTEMKLRYDAVSKKMRTNISYDNKYSDNSDLSINSNVIADQWFMELKKSAEDA